MKNMEPIWKRSWGKKLLHVSVVSKEVIEMELGRSTLALYEPWTSGCASEAMDKLMLLTGLKKVKAL